MPRVGEASEFLKEQPEQEPQTLFEQKELLLKHLKNEFPEFTSNQKKLILVRIFEQSIEDGFSLSQDLGCDKFIQYDTFFYSDVQIKHPKLFQTLKKRINELGIVTSRFILTEDQNREASQSKATDEQEDFVSPECRALLDEIDSYYARVLSQRVESEIERAERKQKNKKQAERILPKLLTPEKQGRRGGMDMGKSALERMYMMAEPHYYVGDFKRELLLPELQRKALVGFNMNFVYANGGLSQKMTYEELNESVRLKNVSDEIFLALIQTFLRGGGVAKLLEARPTFITQSEIQGLSESLIWDSTMSNEVQARIQAERLAFQKKSEKFRYRGDLVDMRLKKLGEEKLLKELKSLLRSNQTIEQDPQTGEYSIYEQEQTSTSQVGGVEREASPEELQEFFDLSKWKSFEFSLKGIRDVSSIRENEQGEIVGTTTDKRTGVKQGFYLSQFDSNHQPNDIEWDEGVIDRIPFPDGKGSLNCIELRATPKFFSIEINFLGEKVHISSAFESVLPETFQKLNDWTYCVMVVEAHGVQKNYLRLNIEIQDDGSIHYRATPDMVYYQSKDSRSSVTIFDQTSIDRVEYVQMLFPDGTRKDAWGNVERHSVSVSEKHCACIFKKSSDKNFYLLNPGNLANKERYAKEDYGEAYTKLIPLRTQDDKVGLYVGVKEKKLWLLRTDGSSIVIGGIDFDPRVDHFNEQFSCAIETPRGMGAVLRIDRKIIFIDPNGNITSQHNFDVSNRQLSPKAQCIGSQYVLPVISYPLSTMGFNIYHQGDDRVIEIPSAYIFTWNNILFSIHNGHITLAGQNGNKFQMYRRSLSELKRTEQIVSESAEPNAEKRKIEYSEMVIQLGERLRLLNMLSKKYADADEFIQEYHRYYINRMHESQTWLEQKQATDPEFLSVIKRVMQKNPKEFLKLNTAEVDSVSPAQVDWILTWLFPEKMKEKKEAGEKQKRKKSKNPLDFLSQSQTITLGGESDPRDTKDAKEVVRSRVELKEPLLKGIYGKYDDGVWHKSELPLTPIITEPSQQRTFSLSVESQQGEFQLPKSVNAKILTERIRGVTTGIAFGFGKKEIPLSVSIKTDGTVSVRVDQKNIKEILYSEIASKLPPVPRDVSQKEYEEMKHRFTREQGSDLIEDFASSLPPEWLDFLKSIKELSPLEQISSIQNFVRTIGYYDFENAEMENKKEGKPFQERLDAMKYRMDELKKRNASGSKAKVLASKQVAGICGDFALLNAALLRKAGFLSVVCDVFVPNGKGTKTSDFHATAGVVWPGENGEYHLFLSDGTPSGVDSQEQQILQQVQQPSIAANVEKYAEEVKEILQEKTEEIKKILQELEQNPAAVSNLRNGVLERSVNVVLQYGVKESHCNVLESVLSLARYGNIDIHQEILLRSAIEDEILLKREKEVENKTPAGTKMFTMFEEYLRRFVKSKMKVGMTHQNAVQESLQTLTKIIDIASPHLEKMEQLAARAILTDLQAKHMKK